MFRKHSSSKRVSSFRPTLEALEDRIVPTEFGDLLSSYGTDLLGKLTIAHSALKVFNQDVVGFDANPNASNIQKMMNDWITLKFADQVIGVQLNNFSSFRVSGGNLLTPEEQNSIGQTFSLALHEVEEFDQEVDQATGDLEAAIFTFLSGGSANISPISLVQIDSFVAPNSVPFSAGSVTASARISGGIDTPVTLSVKGSDGFSDSTTQVIDGDGVIALTIPTGEPKVTDTWTLSIQGEPNESITTTYT